MVSPYSAGRGSYDSPMAAASPARPSTEDQIASIMMRLGEVERRLDIVKEPSAQRSSISTSSPADTATARSLLVPAAQGRFRLSDSFASELATIPSADTAIFDDRHETEHDVMESLSLRRDLSKPENPPFGLWWTYTVEETLLWPILMFNGSVNRSLDVVMLGTPGEDDSGSEDGDADAMVDQSSMTREHGRMGTSHSSGGVQNAIRGDRRGLDDGTVVPELIDSFLKNVHVKHPFLGAAKLRSQAANIIENGIGWDISSCKVLLACALGAISSPWDKDGIYDYAASKPSPERLTMAQEYFLAGQKRLGPLYASSSLEAAHCLFMAGMYYMYVLQPLCGWRLLNSASIACRAYISRKIGREDMRLQHGSPRSMESRLYWSSFMAEREVACEFGMETSGLNVIAYSTSLPTPPSGQPYATEQAGEQSRETAYSIQDERSWYFFLTHIMLRKLEMRIDNYTQAKRREAYRRAGEPPEAFYRSLHEANAEFDYQLSCYYESLPPVMQFPLDDLSPCADELRQYLRWRVSSVRHDICEPSFFALLNYDVSRWSTELVEGLIVHANAMLRLDIAFLWAAGSTHRDANTWLALRKGVRAGLILIAARRLKAQARRELAALQVPDDETCLRAAQALVRGLKHWASESRDCLSNLDMLRSMHPDFRD